MGARRVLADAGARASRSARAGMTLIETLLALTILATALIGMGDFMGRFSHATKVAALQQRSIDLATDRIDSVKHAPDYANIDTMAVTENVTIDSTTYRRQTMVQHVGGAPSDTLDFRVVTVSVLQAGMTTPVRKTTIVSAF